MKGNYCIMLFDLLPKRNEIDGAWDYIVKNLYNSKTCLLYDHAVESEEKFASADERLRSVIYHAADAVLLKSLL